MPKLPPIDFTKLKDVRDLPGWLGVEPARLERLLQDTGRHYTKIRLRKRRHKHATRVVYKLEKELAAAQRHIARSIALTGLARSPEHVQGFVRKRSIATNAGHHLAKRLVLCVDLLDFFGSIPIDKVRNAFRVLGCGTEVAAALADLCTLDGKLPQGASTSPILSNIVARALDEDMLRLGETYGCTYTRYVDDLTFSGDAVPTEEQIADIAGHHGFTVNPDKTRRQPRGGRQYVTGLTVSDSARPRIPRRIKKNLRLALHFAEKYGLASHCKRFREGEEKRLLGLILYVHGVERDLGKRFLAQYERAVAKDRRAPDPGLAHG